MNDCTLLGEHLSPQYPETSLDGHSFERITAPPCGRLDVEQKKKDLGVSHVTDYHAVTNLCASVF